MDFMQSRSHYSIAVEGSSRTDSLWVREVPYSSLPLYFSVSVSAESDAKDSCYTMSHSTGTPFNLHHDLLES